MKAFKVEIITVDHEDCGLEEFLNNLRNVPYYGISVISSVEAEIGEWIDDHPLNFKNTPKEEKLKYFEKQKRDRDPLTDLLFNMRIS
jgi:hypothetical protein